ncbi:MAG: hypothetical protein ACYSW3_00420 [Planctomycetota bacterium]|jgi:hypothetical protein
MPDYIVTYYRREQVTADNAEKAIHEVIDTTINQGDFGFLFEVREGKLYDVAKALHYARVYDKDGELIIEKISPFDFHKDLEHIKDQMMGV